ncbi:unnamed protein product [Rodentolepis nana]|uniref:G_PROTEIN_RECEP_F3_4 domain-containing protein n=1 Tax=Rodentolepis nana TaxID=102285 RepID=A0A0R3TX50_RODNA|nr:unnamed protein product [Rodentolepis nana]
MERMVRVRKLSAALYALTCVCLILALVLPYWECGDLFGKCIQDDDPNRTTMLAVASLLVVSLVFLFPVFVIDTVRLCTKRLPNGTITVRFLFIYIGASAAMASVLTYTSIISKNWAYFLTIFAAGIVFVVQKLAMISSRCISEPLA